MRRQQPRTTRHITTLTTGIVLLLAAGAPGQKIFDGTKKAVLRTHDSVDGGAFLQDRLTRYNDGNADLMKVYDPGQNARSSGVDTVAGGGYVYQTSSKNDWQGRAGAMISAARSNAGCSDCPVVFFAQCTYDPIVVVDTNDAVQVDKAVKLMKYVCDEVKKAGATYVFFATMHFQYTHRPWAESEPFVMREFNRRFSGSTNFRAVDCVTGTLNGWPLSSCGDKRHPTGYGKTIMSDAYFRAMLEFDGIADVPAWSADMIEEQRAEWAKGREWADKYLHLPPPGRYKIGDTLVVRWDPELCKYSSGQFSDVLVSLQFRRTDKAQTGGVRLSHYVQIESLGGVRFTAGAPGQSARADCDGPQNYAAKIPVTASLFDAFGPYKNVPIPLIINASFHQVYQYHWKGSDNNLDSAAQHVFYPSTTIDPALPVYPNVNPDGTPTGVGPANTRRSPDAGFAVRPDARGLVVSGSPFGRGEVRLFDLTGRLVASGSLAGVSHQLRLRSPHQVGVLQISRAGGPVSRLVTPGMSGVRPEGGPQ